MPWTPIPDWVKALIDQEESPEEVLHADPTDGFGPDDPERFLTAMYNSFAPGVGDTAKTSTLLMGSGRFDFVPNPEYDWPMKILMVGNGGREHALLWKLKQDAP